MSIPILIGLTGKRGSGKNTVGEFIKDWAEQNGQKAQLQGFADRLKLSFARIWVPDATLEEALGFCDTIKNIGSIKHDTIFEDTKLFDRFGVRNSITGREALQHYGTEAHRDVFGSNFWVDQLLPTGGGDNGEHIRWLAQWEGDTDYALVSDLRFPNEADRILTLGGFIYNVNRDSLNEQADVHASEQPIDEAYLYGTFQNNDTLEQLRVDVYTELSELQADVIDDAHIIKPPDWFTQRTQQIA